MSDPITLEQLRVLREAATAFAALALTVARTVENFPYEPDRTKAPAQSIGMLPRSQRRFDNTPVGFSKLLAYTASLEEVLDNLHYPLREEKDETST